MQTRILETLLACAATSFAVVGLTDTSVQEYTLEIARQPIATTLQELSKQTGFNVSFVAKDGDKKNLLIGPLKGRYTIESALNELLANSGLTFTQVNEATIAVIAHRGERASRTSRTAKDSEPRFQQLADRWRVGEATEEIGAQQVTAVAGAGDSRPAKTEGGSEPRRAKVVEEIIVTGTRFGGRDALTSPVPVDVVSSEVLRTAGRTELAESLAAALPAFNYTVVSSASSFNAMRLFTYRGLPPNEVLVLVNGKRWHPAGMAGSLLFDFNSIPPTSVASVEVLRDGASAQYGSDAIGGVINVRLRDDTRTELVATSSQYYKGDGLVVETAFDTGMSIGHNGFAHLSAYYRDADRTNRQGRDKRQQYFAFNPSGNPVVLATTSPSDATPILPPGFSFDPRESTGVDRRNNFVLGNAERREAGMNFSSELPISDSLVAYGFGGYTHRTAETPLTWRRPLQNENVRAIYPNGYEPIYDARISDAQLAAGVKGKAGEWDWDLSESWGFNRLAQYSESTLNVSFGTASPTNFFLGTHRLEQATTNLDLKREFNIGLRSPLRVALGSEYRYEGIEVKAGEPASYLHGGVPVLDGPGAGAAAPIGAQGIGGFTPTDAIDTSRDSIAVYVDFENQVTDKTLLTLAGRYEHYSDFGSTVNGKLSFRQEFNPVVAVRGSVSTGFRAPGLYESYYSATGSFVTGGQILVNRVFPVADPAAQALGAQPLEPEESMNYSLGAVITVGDRLTLTADAYRIFVDDTIILSSVFQGAGVVNFLASRGFIGINSARFFTNALDKRVDGLDLVGTYTALLRGEARLMLSAGANFNNPEILSVDATPPQLAAVTATPLFDRQQVVRVEQGPPRSRINLSAIYNYRGLQVLLRGTRYGSTRELGTNPALSDQTFDPKWVTDLELSYEFNDALRLTAGAQNLFDVYPEKNNPFNTLAGSGIFTYPTTFGNSPFGYSGGMYYARALFTF